MSQQIVILGAGYAGMMAALRLSHTTRHRNDIQVTLVNASEYFVERIRLYQLAAGNAPRRRKIQAMLKGTGIAFKQGWVQSLDPLNKLVHVEVGTQTQAMSYDKLVYALGSMTHQHPAMEKPNVYTLDTTSSQELAQVLPDIAARNGKCVVVGSGLTGIEAAAEFAERFPGLQVSMVTSGELGKNLSKPARKYLRESFSELGIRVLENRRAIAVESNHVILGDDTALEADAILWSTGFQLPAIAKDAGIKVNQQGQMIADATMRSLSHPDIYGAGDCIRFSHSTRLPALRLSCQVAMPMGAHVGDTLSREIDAKSLQPFEFGYQLQCIDLGGKRALVQMTQADDTPTERIVTGRKAALIKWGILNYTMQAILLTRRFKRAYTWPAGLKSQDSAETTLMLGTSADG